ncbi:alpha-L-fucosidase [Lutibacter citreus]|uniref:alpha-L-fucosidase n=1 Tax=Lutibacter citreus TaxID=2138210 RepID=UPI001C553406|nr:alpha-L-fucosidase [Lutibacter citreus]
MKINNSLNLLVLIPLLLFLSCKNKPETDKGISETNTHYDGSWEALQKMPVPTWFDDGKIGLFIHWGPYSAIGYKKEGRGYAEHVPKQIYEQKEHYYPYLKERWGAAPPDFG